MTGDYLGPQQFRMRGSCEKCREKDKKITDLTRKLNATREVAAAMSPNVDREIQQSEAVVALKKRCEVVESWAEELRKRWERVRETDRMIIEQEIEEEEATGQ